MKTLLTCQSGGWWAPVPGSSLYSRTCRLLLCFSNERGEHPSSQLWEELGPLGLRTALFVLRVSQPFLNATPLSSGLNYGPHWAQDRFLNLRGKVYATAFPSIKLIYPSLSISSLSPEHSCSKIPAPSSRNSSRISLSINICA